jgi:hypothetical protein
VMPSDGEMPQVRMQVMKLHNEQLCVLHFTPFSP